jgi:RimJ/RimL family protein N-acetyltransferase
MQGSQTDILLRHPKISDRELLYRWINDRELVIRNAPFKEIAEEEHDIWFQNICLASTDRVFFIIELISKGVAIGSCQLLNIHSIHQSAELQIRIGEWSEHGRGYGTEAIKQLTKFGFEVLKLHRIGLHVFANNMQAIRAYQKAGFKIEGCLKEAVCIEGKFIDVVLMGILNKNG